MKQKLTEKTREILRINNLRLTKQRIALVSNIFKFGNRHINAESLHNEMVDIGIKVSLAAVYNTLHGLTKLGLLRHVKVNSNQSYFDTNITKHHHFYDESNNSLIDIPENKINITDIPSPPKNKKISDVEVIISLRDK